MSEPVWSYETPGLREYVQQVRAERLAERRAHAKEADDARNEPAAEAEEEKDR